ncbi:glycosyl transferase family 36 [Salipaludibacillus keqinensis]|uniref:Glycosyl transferase family 36 n=1 Tax=Salipaludibacillus keqinensis TaxID=2045207 RepID=A0A323T992_9BACI|nr:glucoamylase family protein [Salipaludibacillus keqinensis]PYZ92292.1 glycosyl transferase family 36 [Salipaludibacillus keqinensis]
MTLTIKQLQEKAHHSALKHDPFVKKRSSSRFWKRNETHLEEIRSFVEKLYQTELSCSQPAEEWLLDNKEFIEEQFLSIKESSSKQYLNSLPHLKNTGELRVLSLCSDYVNLTDGVLTNHTFKGYLKAYQEVSILTLGEVWSLPLMLRVALIRHLASSMETIEERHDICKQVEAMLADIETESLTPEKLKEVLDKEGFELPLSGPMTVHLVKHLRERADYSVTVGEWLMCKLENGPESLDHIMSYEYQLQASYQLTTGNLITSLRQLIRWDWQEEFEELSLVEQTLSKESAGVYSDMDFASRETLRKRVETLARRMGVPENLIATKALELANTRFDQQMDHSLHQLSKDTFVSYYLLETKGLVLLRKALKSCSKPKGNFRSGMKKKATTSFFALYSGLFILVFTVLFLLVSQNSFLSPLEWIVIGLVLILPASEWAVVLGHWMIEKVTQPVPLLKYDFSEGVPEDAKTIVVIPVIWSDQNEVEKLTERLELHYLANRTANLHFALLGDFKDYENKNAPGDRDILQAAKEKVARLNDTYSDSSFYLFHRCRVWNGSESMWMGWERKRGKLVEFVELLKGKPTTSFDVIVGDRKRLKEIRYILTLDADTELPLESAQRMVGAIHLPFNRPRLNLSGTRVVDGYGVLQPRIGMSHEAASRSRFASMRAADPGVDPYSFAVSDPYQDGLGEGIFTGKGIFDVDTFHQVLCERIPENRLLSHDLLEGGFLRAGFLSDIELVDDHPAKFFAHQKRLHRWVRGDWQLLLWLLPKTRNRRGEVVPVDLSVLTRWQIIDNLRRSLMVPGLLLLLIGGLTIFPGSPAFWTGLVLATFFLPVIRQLLTFHQGGWFSRSILQTFIQVMTTIITLPFQAALLLDAIGRTLYRLSVSKRRLLEWTPAADVDKSIEDRDRPMIAGLFGGYVITAFLVIVLFLTGEIFSLIVGVIFAFLWVLAPFVIRWLDSPISQDHWQISSSEKEELTKLSKDIWSFYNDYVIEDDNWLPPDNVQINPAKGIAHRTSPTNIGLYLASVIAAKDFSFITTEEMIERIERTMDTIERMEKWEGHLYNWYDTVTLEPLHPTYVSTVDSGNFVGCLIAVKEGVLEWLNAFHESAPTPPFEKETLKLALSEELAPVNIKGLTAKRNQSSWQSRVESLVTQIDETIHATNFRPLYNHQAKLFSLGYQVDRNSQDDVLYDLMASEARQASYIAIALGQVSVDHWNTLGRTMSKVENTPVLLSWSGTMFEYLMPMIFMKTYKHSLWETTYRGVVQRQIVYAKQRGVPYGISESGYYAFDYQMNYQYRAFGVPGLGFKRGLEQDLVVSPYGTILSLPYARQEGFKALNKIEQFNGRGKYGFYEAIDFTKERLPKDTDYKVIQSYMAHHQGMSLLTITNLLHSDVMVERFHRNKPLRSAELLLQERVPKRPKVIEHHAMNRKHKHYLTPVQNVAIKREFQSVHTKTPEVCILSNGKFTTVVTNTGSGYSQHKGRAVSRWRQDPIQDSWGSYIYVRDTTKDEIRSPSFLPCRYESDEQTVQFELGRATFMKRNEDMDMSMEISVSPEWDAEIRRVTLSNTSEDTKIIEVTTFTELALAPFIADEAHPAFSKLFIRTSFDTESGCLVAGRRPREVDDQTIWAAHTLMLEGEAVGSVEYETDRGTFIGRGHSLSDPQGIRTRLKGKIGSVADPAFVMRRRITVKPGEQVQLAAITSVADTKEEAVDIVQRFSSFKMIERNFQLAWNRSEIELRHLHITNKQAQQFQTFAGQVLYCPPLKQDRIQHIIKNNQGQSKLWSYGISGDLPIVLVRVDRLDNMKFVVDMLIAHEYLRRHGMLYDLVIFNESEEGYHQQLQEALQQTVEHGIDRFGQGTSSVHVIEASQIDNDDKTLFQSVARLVLLAWGPSLRSQLNIHKDAMRPELPKKLIGTQAIPPSRETSKTMMKDKTADLLFYNGWGGFSPDGKKYQMLMKNDDHLPAPWINVLANPHFGCFISELGTGYTWWRNSRECKVTPWSNDPVLDPPGEKLFVRDEDSGEVWSGTRSEANEKEAYFITHGRGFTEFEHERHDIEHKMTVYVPLEDPIKVMKVTLKNHSFEPRRMSLTYYAEWVLGVQRQSNAPYIVTKWSAQENVLTARNHYQQTFQEANAFLGIFSEEELALSWTSDREEFIGRNGDLVHPAAMNRQQLSGRAGSMYETCGAIQGKLTLQPNSQQTVYILLGCTSSEEETMNLVKKYKDSAACRDALENVDTYWTKTLDHIQVETPSQEMDILLNGWLVYQSLACRIWGRSAFYQSGGAYGYRDQLQDSLSLLHVLPDKTRKQILLHGAHQYEEGDVQHWWHEETNMGIRTMFSDDLLWLPYAVSRYIDHTGDRTILDEVVPYLRSEVLQEGEHERYEPTVVSEKTGTIYDHCLRAIDIALKRKGEHELPLIGVGDWNDGMNLVGAEGRGESVWLGWFICDILKRFEQLSAEQNDQSKEAYFKQNREEITKALHEHGWDGQWYRRAFTDQGHWLGSIENDECRIDAIAQSWSVISGAAPKERAIQAMTSFNRELVDRDLSVIRLLTPPFDKTKDSPGYIQGYPPGIRENGAQYTHGVIWSIVAYSQLGQGDQAMEMFQLLNPITHTRTDHEVRQYKGEPYVMAADVYTAEPHKGQAGWTWYTGAAGWMYQAGLEWILGIRRQGDYLVIDPSIPSDWDEFYVRYTFGESVYMIEVNNVKGQSKSKLKVDDVEVAIEENQPRVLLNDDGKEHLVQIYLGVSS